MRSAKMEKDMLNLCGKFGKYGNYAEVLRSFVGLKNDKCTRSQVKHGGKKESKGGVGKIEATAVFLVGVWRNGQGVIDQPVIALSWA